MAKQPKPELVHHEDYTGRTMSGRPFPCFFCGEAITGPGAATGGATGPKIDLHLECLFPMGTALIGDAAILNTYKP